jgi:hypothetical protein
MKAAKTASQIKRFVHLFRGHAPKNTPGFFFRHSLIGFYYALIVGLVIQWLFRTSRPKKL